MNNEAIAQVNDRITGLGEYSDQGIASYMGEALETTQARMSQLEQAITQHRASHSEAIATLQTALSELASRLEAYQQSTDTAIARLKIQSKAQSKASTAKTLAPQASQGTLLGDDSRSDSGNEPRHDHTQADAPLER